MEGTEVKLEVCPCCDFRTIERLCMNDICPVCGWEDDGLNPERIEHLSMGGNGPNGMTLREGRKAFLELVANKGLPSEAAQYEHQPRNIPQ